MINDVFLEQYINMPELQLSMIINCKLRELYAHKRAFGIAYNLLLKSPFVVNVSTQEMDREIQKLKCWAKLRRISLNVTEVNVKITLNDVIYALREILERNIMLVNDCDCDPYSITFKSNRDKKEIIANLRNDLNKVIASLDEGAIGLNRCRR